LTLRVTGGARFGGVSAKVGADDVRPRSIDGLARLAEQVQGFPSLLLADVSLKGCAIHVEDHSSHFLVSHRNGTDPPMVIVIPGGSRSNPPSGQHTGQ
jgi:hypothetical protein